jgi:hypothetical protein
MMKRWILMGLLFTSAGGAHGREMPVARPTDPFTLIVADSMGVTPDEAARRLNMRTEGVRARRQAMVELKERYAGSDYTDVPGTLTIRLTGDVPLPARTLPTPYGPLTLQFIGGAPHTIAELSRARTSDAFTTLFSGYGNGVDETKGELYVEIREQAELEAFQADAAAIERAVGVPVTLRKLRPVQP